VFFGKIYVILTSNVLIGKNVFENYVFFNCSVIKSTIVLVLPCFAIYMSVIDSSRNICNCIRNASVNTYMMGRDMMGRDVRNASVNTYMMGKDVRNASVHTYLMGRR
jgi:hypothetical protein